MDTFCFGSGQQTKKVNFNSQVKQTEENKLKQNPKYHEKVSTNYSLYFVIHVHLHPLLDFIQTWKLKLESQSISLFEIIPFFKFY